MDRRIKFIRSKSIKIDLLPEQRSSIKSDDEIVKLCNIGNVIAFDIVFGESIVGFAMLRNFEEGGWFLWNYAIDWKFQGRSYGKKALIELISMIQREYELKTMTTTYTVGNDIAKNLYESVGFEFVNEVREDDIEEVNMAYFVDRKKYNYSLD